MKVKGQRQPSPELLTAALYRHLVPLSQLRREAANMPAREAAAAVRRAALGPDATAEGVAAARAALHEAVAAAADACGQCERYQGENEELDAAWIACDTCQRWGPMRQGCGWWGWNWQG